MKLKQPTNDLDQIYRAAESSQPEFSQAIARIAEATEGRAIIPALKERARAQQKIAADYNGNAEEIKDILRASISFRSLSQIYQGLERLNQENLEGLLIKDRFEQPTKVGYRDLTINIRTSNGTIAEIQFHLEQILEAKEQGHKYYEQERGIRSRAALQDRELTPAEEAQIKILGAEQTKLYETAFQQAQTTPAQLGQADTTSERLTEGSKTAPSAVPTHQSQLPPQKDVSQLVAWQQVARALNRPDNYLNRISEITKTYKAGEPVSSGASSAMQHDFAAHEQSLDQLRDWHRAARFLGYSDRYQARIVEVANAFKAGASVSERAIRAMSQDLDVQQQKLEAIENWQKVARAIGQPEEYCARITKVVEACKAGCPLSDRAKVAMQQDVQIYQQTNRRAVALQGHRGPDREIGE